MDLNSKAWHMLFLKCGRFYDILCDIFYLCKCKRMEILFTYEKKNYTRFKFPTRFTLQNVIDAKCS